MVARACILVIHYIIFYVTVINMFIRKMIKVIYVAVSKVFWTLACCHE